MPTYRLNINNTALLGNLTESEIAVLFVNGESGRSNATARSSVTEEKRSTYCLAFDSFQRAQTWQDLSQPPHHFAEQNIDLEVMPHHFVSGWAGVINYRQSVKDEESLEFYFFDASYHFDSDSQYGYLCSRYDLSPERLESLSTRLKQIASNTENSTSLTPISRQWSPAWSIADYQQKFAKVEEFLHAGDCYQVNLTFPFFCNDDLTQCNPIHLLNKFDAPMSAFFKTPQRWITSVSPERFLRIENGQITTNPIKGTTPRSSLPEEDQAQYKELQHSIKNQSENLMIVDLLRNDLSISAKPNSVVVDKLFEIESHHNVHQMVSTISADLRDNLTPIDAVRHAFPGGSITGAPKKRAMEIIDDLEVQSRGAYCGSLGYFDVGGLVDLNILIRTIEATTAGAVCWGGGGVTVQSTAEDEYQEVLHKVGKILSHPL